MTETQTIIREIEKGLPVLRDKYGIRKIGIFGSYLRGEQKRKSDLDILVDFEKTVSFFEFLALEGELSRLTGKKVDLVMKTALKPGIGKHILREVVYL
ncbi:MAG: nucleotidyltransferase family protein [Thermodesulfovibrionales bacterium]